ncbi:MAG TPA: SAM-dependent methyltransferase [Verrucomicrobiae bacterium]
MPKEIIREEIAKKGVISFTRFMELALYCPETGYYESERGKVGRGGDFITSVSTGNLFGQMLAFQFAEWLAVEASSQKSGVRIVETGAHDGKLAQDVLTWLQAHRPQLFAQLEYVILEPSARRQSWQQESLKEFSNVHWSADLAGLKLKTQNSKLNGVLFSNELLDAFPVRRFGWSAGDKKWFEWGVTVENEQLAWTKMPQSRSEDIIDKSSSSSPSPSPDEENSRTRTTMRTSMSHLPSSILHLPSALLEVLPDGYIVETSPAGEAWWRTAAEMLAGGKLLAIDYGFSTDELFSPSRLQGTLRAYHQHHVSSDLLANPGEQDLTAHVNFSALQTAGETAGLVTENFCSQAKFLTQILAKTQAGKSFGEWNQARTRQFQTLTHPEHFGRAFRVLVQARG